MRALIKSRNVNRESMKAGKKKKRKKTTTGRKERGRETSRASYEKSQCKIRLVLTL